MEENQSLLSALRPELRPVYEVDSEIGRGGMAAVFLATDTRHDRAVAIKVLLPAVAEHLGADRFIREIRIAARLAHPNILPLFDSGEAAGLPFYVTPYVPGDDLKATLTRQGRFQVSEAVTVIADAAHGLDHAHGEGVIHRDVKPGNILLADRVAVVADFGIARAIGLAGGERLTRSGISLGTPYYMSPEQAFSGHEATAASDQYSLACVLFELLTGAPPYSGNTARKVFLSHAVDAIPSVLAQVPDLPADLNAVVRKGLSKTPEARYPSIRDFAEQAVATCRASAGGPLTDHGSLD